MLTGVHVVFIGGDARQLEVIKAFSEKDATITLIGFDQLETNMRNADLTEEVLRTADAIILPAVGTDETGKVASIFSDKELNFAEPLIGSLQSETKIYTGMAKPYLKQLCEKYHVTLIELFERDEIAIYNSIPTAEGAIMMAIQNTDITIHGSHCIVLGIGRTGLTLARTLLGLGAKVKAGVRREEQYARAYEMGLNPFMIQHLSDEVYDVDLLFNTIPTMIVKAQVIVNIPQHAVIIDLASKPGGTDFRFAEKRGIKALLAPGLPGIVAPKTAGQIIAKCLIQLILEDAKKRGSDNGVER